MGVPPFPPPGVLKGLMIMMDVTFLGSTDEFLARHYEEKARQRQAQQEEKRKVTLISS